MLFKSGWAISYQVIMVGLDVPLQQILQRLRQQCQHVRRQNCTPQTKQPFE
jgi:hypothetical protein